MSCLKILCFSEDAAKVKSFSTQLRKLKDALNPNLILVDLSPLLDTDIENIRLEFKKLLKVLKEKAIQDLDQKEEDVEGFNNLIMLTHLLHSF